MSSIALSARVFVEPWSAVPRVVAERRWFWPLLVLAMACAFSGLAFGLRWEASPVVARELEDEGELSKVTDREFTEKVETAKRVAMVAGTARGLFLTPAILAALALALKVIHWLFDRPVPYGRCLAALAASALPMVVLHVLLGASLLAQTAVSTGQLQTLVPSSLASLWATPGTRAWTVLSLVELFRLWSVTLLGLALSTSMGWTWAKGVVLAFVLYAAYAGVFLIGIPSLTGGAT